MYLALLFTLIFLNGLFAMTEIALVTAKRSRLQRLAEQGDRTAALAVRLGQEPTRFLSTIQIGITAIGLLSGIVSEAVLAGPVATLLVRLGVKPEVASPVSTILVVACVTYFSIVFGELLPKRIAQIHAETIARLMARPIAALAQLSRPFVYILSLSTDGLLHLSGRKGPVPSGVTEEDIEAMLADGSQAGVIEKTEHAIVRNVFRLDDRQISSLMSPRSEIIYLDVDQPFAVMREALLKSSHSRFPVCQGGLGNILGTVTAKQLLQLQLAGEPENITSCLRPAVYVPESLTGMELLEHFRESGAKMVFVVDEYGEVLGLVTLQNVLVALAGEFKPRDPEDLWAFQREDGSWLLDGLIPVPELKDRLGLKTVPEEDRSSYNTLGGMMLWLIGRIPRTGDQTEWEGWRFEVLDLDGNRIDKVLASRLSVETDAPAASPTGKIA